MVGTLSQGICLSNHHIAHFKYLKVLFVSYISRKVKKKKKTKARAQGPGGAWGPEGGGLAGPALLRAGDE